MILKQLYYKLINSTYWERLFSLLPLFIFFIILKAYIGITYIQNTDPVMTVLIRVNGLPLVYTKAILAGFVWSVIYISLIAIPRNKKIQNVLASIITVFSIWIFFVEGFLLEAYGLGYPEETLTIALATNIQETKEFFESVFAFDKLLKPLIIFILAVLSYLISSKMLEKEWGKFQRAKQAIFFTLLILSLPSLYHLRGVYNRLSGTFLAEVSAPIERVLIGTNTYMIHQAKQKEVADKLHLNIPKVNLKKDINDIKVILILGESLRKDYMHCYGYPLNNTPRLDSLFSDEKGTLFTDVVSPGSSTIQSLEEVLSFHTQHNTTQAWHQFASLPQAFSAAGYWTQWTSNQEKTGATNSIYMISQTSDSTYYIGAGSITRYASKKQSLDEALLPHLDLKIDKKSDKIFQVFHLIGNHLRYSCRYPKSFERFKVEDLPNQERYKYLSQKQKQIIIDYINSIYYNDYIVSSIVKHYAKDKSLVIYISDHGQVLYDDPSNLTRFGHGMTEQSLSVPMLMFVSDKFKESYPEITEAIRSAKDKPFMLDLLTHSLTALFGIETEYHNPKLELFDNAYDKSRPRIVKDLGKTIVF